MILNSVLTVEELPLAVGEPVPELALVDVAGVGLEDAPAVGAAGHVVAAVAVPLGPVVLPLAVRKVLEPLARVPE